MPKPVSRAELQRVHDVVLRYPAGIGIAKLEQELGRSISRRTLVRRLRMLLEAEQIRRRGERKGALYLPAADAPSSQPQLAEQPGQFETPDGPVEIPLTAAAREVLQYVSRPGATRHPIGQRARSRATFSVDF